MDADKLVRLIDGWSEGHGSLHRRLSEALGRAVKRGELRAGERLPAERALARALAVSRTTVVSAYGALREEDLVKSRRGSGTRVAERPWGLGDQRGSVRRVSDLATGAAQGRMLGAGGVRQEGQDDIVDFALSAPPVPEGAAALMAEEATVSLMAERQYRPAGLPALRGAIAWRYTRNGLPTHPGEVLITTGAHQAIALVAALYLERGDRVVVEDPTYYGALDVFRAAGARLVPVPVGARGADVGALRSVVVANSPGLVYLTPTFHNPTGAVMPQGARRDVASLAAETGVPVLSDDTLSELAIDELDPPPTIAAFAQGGTLLTIGSLSKLYWSGLRVGWVRAPRPVIRSLTRLKVTSDLGSAYPSQAVAARVLDELERAKRTRREELLRGRDRLCTLLGEHLPSWAFERPSGGQFLWVRLPRGDSRAFAQLALRHGVAVVPGPDASAGGGYAEYLRLAFVLGPADLEDGVERLASAWSAYDPSLDASRPNAAPLI